VKIWANDFFPQQKLPFLGGTLDSNFQAEKNADSPWIATAQLRTEGLEINQFKIGQVQTQFNYKDLNLKLNELSVVNPGMDIKFDKTEISFTDKENFSTLVHLEKAELSQALVQLGLKRPPVTLHLAGDLPCHGQLSPTPTAECTGSIRGTDLIVVAKDNPQKTVVNLTDFKIEGSVKVDNKGVYPKGSIEIGKTTKGVAEGSVSFEDGFDFQYSTDAVYFSDVKDLANLRLQGSSSLKGTTKGNSDYAIIDMAIGTKDLWLTDYGVGDATAKMSYRSGLIKFEDVIGSFNNTKYLGTVSVNLPTDSIKADFQMPLIEINDMQKALERKAKLPFDAFGLGSGHIKVEGPLEFTALTYDVKSQFSQGFVGTENFDRAYFDVHAIAGKVVSDRIEVQKGIGTIRMDGKGFPDGNIDTFIHGRNLMLEDFLSISDKGMGLTGQMNFDMTMKGHVLRPQVSIGGSATKVAIMQQVVPDSHFSLGINADAIKGTADIMANTIKTSFNFPLQENLPFHFHLTTEKWNFAPLFSMISSKQQNYDTALTSRINLDSPTGGYKNSSGSIHVDTFFVRRNSLEMSAPKPIDIDVKSGVIRVENFSVQGDNTQLTAVSKPAAPKNSTIQLSGTVDMSLLSFLTPFLQEIRGILSLSTQIKFGENRIQLLGSAYIDKGYVKLKEFPHPLEQLKTDVLFNENKIIINSFNGNLAGGRLNAEGSILLDGYKNFPTDISLTVEDTTLKVPEGFTSRGSGTATLKGNWFPFLLQGNYAIKEGVITRSYQSDDAAGVKRSSFLPRLLLQESFDPIEFNVQTTLVGNYRVRNSILDTGISGALLIKGTPSNPVLIGEVKPLKGGQIFFRDAAFSITGGSVKFDTPQEINPLISATATTSVKSREYDTTLVTQTTSQQQALSTTDKGRIKEYEINLAVQGRMKNYKITLNSQPPLEEPDIISLLALGVTSQQLERRQSSDQVTDLGSAILSQNVKLQNPLFDVKFSSAGGTEDTNTTDSKVILSRQWTPKVSTAVGRTMRTNVTDAKVKYQLNRNLSAILNWEGAQTIEDPTTQAPAKTINDTVGLGLEYGVEFK